MQYEIRHDRVRGRVVDGEAVLIHLRTTHYFSLNRTGTVLWELLSEHGRSFEELVDAVAHRFGRGASEVSADVRKFLDHMVEEDLIGEGTDRGD